MPSTLGRYSWTVFHDTEPPESGNFMARVVQSSFRGTAPRAPNSLEGGLAVPPYSSGMQRCAEAASGMPSTALPGFPKVAGGGVTMPDGLRG